MQDYYSMRKNYEINLVNELNKHSQSNDLLEFLEQSQGHSKSVHACKTDKELIQRVLKEFKIAATFNSEQEQNKILYKVLSMATSEIVDWLYKDTSKKLQLNLQVKKPIGVALDLFLNKYEINKIKVVLTRDDTLDLKFRLTTMFPNYDKDSKPLGIKLERPVKEPRLLPFFAELTNFKNKNFYNAVLYGAGTTMNITNVFNNTKYSIILSEDKIEPEFYINDKINHEYVKITPREFYNDMPQVFKMLCNYKKEWEKQPIPIKANNQIKMDILEKYCIKNNINFKLFENLNDTMYKYARQLARDNNPAEILLRDDIDEEMAEIIIQQFNYNKNDKFKAVDIKYYLGDNCQYNKDQLEVLFRYASRDIDTTLMENKHFTPDQMIIIAKGLNYNKNHPDNKINVKRLARPNISEQKMVAILNEEIQNSKRIGENLFKQNNYTSIICKNYNYDLSPR